MGIAIRKATIGDAFAIARVQVMSWRSTYRGLVPDSYLDLLNVEVRAARWREALAARSAILFVAEDAGEIVGFISGGVLREPIAQLEAELYAIYLLQEWQGQGIGRRLTQQLVATLLGSGYKSMAVWVLEKNPAVGFYKRLGGTMIGRKMIEIGGAQLDEIALGWSDLGGCFPTNAPVQDRGAG